MTLQEATAEAKTQGKDEQGKKRRRLSLKLKRKI
jgi:hypothetical protein